MYLTFNAPNGKQCYIGWGEVWSEPYSRKVGEKGAKTTSFFFKHDSERDRDSGKYVGKTISVSAWGKLSDRAALLEKHSEVVVLGMIQKDDYNSEKYHKPVFKVFAQEIIPTSDIWSFLTNQMSSKESYPDGNSMGEFSSDDIPSFDGDYDSLV